MRKLLQRIVDFVKRPGGVENESGTLIVLVRGICLVALVYCPVIGTVLFLNTGSKLCWMYMAAEIITAASFAYTYKGSVRTPYIIILILLMLGSLIPVCTRGWALGFQCLFFCDLLLVVFNPLFRPAVKRVVCVVFILVLIALELFVRSPVVMQDEIGSFAFLNILLLNQLFFMISLSIIGLTVANVSQEAEHQLLLYNNKLRELAGRDPLTGLQNRRYTERRLGEIVNGYTASRDLVTVAMADIDFFKKINDTYGHEAGDYVLKEIAASFKELADERTIVARWGGEEFLLVFIGKNGDDVFSILDKYAIKLRDRKFVYHSSEISITMTFGISEYDGGPDFENTIREADEKLYIGKQNGRDTIVF